MTGTTGNTQTTTALHATREGWLLLASDLLAAEIFAPHGYLVPGVKVSVGYASTGLRISAIGQCWSRKSAEDDTNHIFISPSLGTAYEVRAGPTRSDSFSLAVKWSLCRLRVMLPTAVCRGAGGGDAEVPASGRSP